MAWSKNTDWSEYYRIPTHFSDRYLERLGVVRQPVSRAFLDTLVRAHLLTIPFENLDTTDLNRPVSIHPERLMEKLLLKKRGGFCFELNGAFCMLLTSLGFDAWLCPCRQMRHSEPCPVPATHCGILIHLGEETYFCDVGYGGPVPRGSLQFSPSDLQQIEGEVFYFQKSGITPADPRSTREHSGWYTLIRQSLRSGRELPLMQMAPVECYLCDFYGQSLLRSDGATAYSVRHVTRMLPDGYIDLTENELTISTDNFLQRTVVSDSELAAVLHRWFGIDL